MPAEVREIHCTQPVDKSTLHFRYSFSLSFHSARR